MCDRFLRADLQEEVGLVWRCVPPRPRAFRAGGAPLGAPPKTGLPGPSRVGGRQTSWWGVMEGTDNTVFECRVAQLQPSLSLYHSGACGGGKHVRGGLY